LLSHGSGEAPRLLRYFNTFKDGVDDFETYPRSLILYYQGDFVCGFVHVFDYIKDVVMRKLVYNPLIDEPANVTFNISGSACSAVAEKLDHKQLRILHLVEKIAVVTKLRLILYISARRRVGLSTKFSFKLAVAHKNDFTLEDVADYPQSL
jgi:hypothetical protein